jgi:ElaB/YqjD/DUF883 family membrane-anchored ribosome-binding protein
VKEQIFRTTNFYLLRTTRFKEEEMSTHNIDTKHKQEFMNSLQETLNQYEEKISSLPQNLKNYSSQKKAHLSSGLETMKKKFEEAKKIYKKLEEATEDNWEEIKNNSLNAFEELKKTFKSSSDSDLSPISHFNEISEEVVDYAHEKINHLNEYIKARPLTAAFWALGIGFILGKVLRTK